MRPENVITDAEHVHALLTVLYYVHIDDDNDDDNNNNRRRFICLQQKYESY